MKQEGNGMDRRYMIKQRVGQITTKTGELEVFTTGLPGYFLFCPMQSLGNGTFASGTIQISHHNRDLVRGWRRRLH